jgi:hypothetical protein
VTKYLIDDIGVNGHHARLQKFGEIICGRQMTREIERWSEWKNFNSATTLLVFPGNGANIVRGFMDADKWLLCWRTASATAKRFWIPGEPPQAIAGRIFPDRFLLGMKDIVVIDDVVSSGETVKKLRAVNMPWIPAARWHVATWVMQRAANLRGFQTHFATVEVGESGRKDPINSLSTLVENVEIADSYARRNFPNPEAFLALLNELR